MPLSERRKQILSQNLLSSINTSKSNLGRRVLSPRPNLLLRDLDNEHNYATINESDYTIMQGVNDAGLETAILYNGHNLSPKFD